MKEKISGIYDRLHILVFDNHCDHFEQVFVLRLIFKPSSEKEILKGCSVSKQMKITSSGGYDKALLSLQLIKLHKKFSLMPNKNVTHISTPNFRTFSATILSCMFKFVLTLSLVHHVGGNRILVIIKLCNAW